MGKIYNNQSLIFIMPPPSGRVRYLQRKNAQASNRLIDHMDTPKKVVIPKDPNAWKKGHLDKTGKPKTRVAKY